MFLKSEKVKNEWTDYNGHMNVAYYILIFDQHGSEVLLTNFTNIINSITQKSINNNLPEIIEFVIKETLLTNHYNDDKKNGKSLQHDI